MAFTKAVRKKSKLRLGITGPSGSGKTLGALLIAKGLGGKIAVIDTEKGSASLYADNRKYDVEFDSQDLDPPYAPENFIKAMREAEQGGYDVLIIDSTTHEWSGVGGCLELVDEIAKARYKGNSWSAWSDITPRHRAFIDAIQRSPMHVIITMRSKTETAQTEGQNGKKQVVKLGMKAEQRDGFEYEMTVVLDVVHDTHFVQTSKDRTGLFMDRDPFKISEATGVMLREWLESGAEPAPEGVTAQELADWQAAIESAADMESLVAEYKAAVKLARERKDKLSEDAFVAAKDKRKKQLEQPQPEFEDEDIPY
ncbi:ATP-binding protein [Paraburkholderia elongata]|uniref:AAA family ATPase n=1 Tax=Paraburkholderia elongata TaxID=2675747 RepID=A0A972NTX7_9BURK|nr:ATP-binding protein [Paraburkholderia elongata]NPT59041.1 AAA family ATPase [Paraburkholderia elongata]